MSVLLKQMLIVNKIREDDEDVDVTCCLIGGKRAGFELQIRKAITKSTPPLSTILLYRAMLWLALTLYTCTMSAMFLSTMRLGWYVGP